MQLGLPLLKHLRLVKGAYAAIHCGWVFGFSSVFSVFYLLAAQVSMTSVRLITANPQNS